jgi:hypothetical protein
VPSRARLLWGVGGELPVDHIGEAPAQAAHRFHRGFPFGDAAAVVGAAGGVVAELDDASHVEHVVDAAVPGPGQAVVGVLAGGGVDGGGAGPGGEVGPVGEAGHVTDIGEDPCGAGGADAVDVHQP